MKPAKPEEEAENGEMRIFAAVLPLFLQFLAGLVLVGVVNNLGSLCSCLDTYFVQGIQVLVLVQGYNKMPQGNGANVLISL